MPRVIPAFLALVTISLGDTIGPIFATLLHPGRSPSLNDPALSIVWAAMLLLPAAIVFLTAPRRAVREEVERGWRNARWRIARLSVTGVPLLGLGTSLLFGARPSIESVIDPRIPGASSALLLLPFFLGWGLAAGVWYRLENRREQIPESPFRSLRRELRPALLVLSISVTIAAFADLSWLFPEIRELLHLHPIASVGGIVFAITAMILISPTAVGWLHPRRSLPAGTLRDRFEQTAAAANTHLGRVEIWNTGPRPGLNACVAGAIPRHRRVFFTDGLIASLPEEELAGVFAHELAHSRLNHLWIYSGLILGLSGLTLGLESVVTVALEKGWLTTAPAIESLEWLLLLVIGLFFFRFFGVLSRHFESQADLFSADTTGSPWGIVQALQKIGAMTGTLDRKAGWRHPSIPERVATVLQCWGDPQQRRRFRKKTRRLLSMWALVLAIGGIGAIYTLKVEWSRPAWESSLDRAHYLLYAAHERQSRPGADPEWVRASAESARDLLIEVLPQVPRDRTELRRSAWLSLAHAYRQLNAPWSAAIAEYFGQTNPGERDPSALPPAGR